MVLPEPAAPGDGEDHRHVGAIDLLLVRGADRPTQTARAQGLPERAGQPLPRIRQNAAEAQACRAQPGDLLNRDLRLGSVGQRGSGPPLLASRVGSLVQLSGRTAASAAWRNLIARQVQRHQRLAVGVLTEGRSILRRDADRMCALHQKRCGRRRSGRPHPRPATHRPAHKRLFQRRSVPDACADEVMQLVVADAPSGTAKGCTLFRSPIPSNPAT